MSTKTSEAFGRMTGISSEMKTAPITGWVIFGFGALYMLVLGWLSSWWVVPTIRQAGLEGLPGAAFFYFWQVAAPVGALVAVIGAAFVAGVERSRKAVIIVGSLVVVLYLFFSMGAIRQVIPPIFGIGGGLISLAFLGSAWEWARSRPRLDSAVRAGADFVLVGQVFYLIAAWYLCGLLGAPTFLLRPELALTIMPENTAVSLGTTILICMALGSMFTFLGRRVAGHK